MKDHKNNSTTKLSLQDYSFFAKCKIYINSLLFNIFFILWTFLVGGLFLPSSILSKKMAQWFGYFWGKNILRVLKFLCDIEHEIIGAENIKQKPYIIASKHESNWDTIFLLQYFYNPVFVLKRELLFFPVYGLHLLAMGMIPINRKKGKESLRTIITRSKILAKQNRKIIIFPQGTRTLPKQKLPYKAGIYAIAKESKLDILPISLDSGNLWQKNSFIKLPGKITVKILPEMTLDNSKKGRFMEDLADNIESNCR